MRIAILGAGFAGLSAAWDLALRSLGEGGSITIFEKAPEAGGAAGGFKQDNWDWYLDYVYHHWFTNDTDMFQFCKEIGWEKIITKRPITASAYGSIVTSKTGKTSNYQLPVTNYRLDSPVDLLKFPKLSVIDRLRTGAALATLKLGPALSSYHTTTAHEWAQKKMGKASWEVLWKPLMVKKYGEYADMINAMFFWARIKKRTPSLVYPEGGFQALANYTVEKLKEKGVVFKFKYQITNVKLNSNNKFVINDSETFDAVISTLPTPIFLQIEKGVLPSNYRKQLSQIQYIGAQTLIYESDEPLIKDIYWLNIADMNNPWMVAVAHTNFMNKQHFGGKHITYIAKYGNTQITNDKFTNKIQNSNVKKIKEFFIPYGQPLYTTNYSRIFPQTVSPVPGLYFASMEQTYPYDRGTNYAVKVGREAAKNVITNTK